MANPWEKYQTPDVVSQGGPWSKYGNMTPREAVDALPDFLTRTAAEKQEDESRKEAERLAYQQKLAEIPVGMYGPAWNDRAKFRDTVLEEQGKTMTRPEAALVRLTNSAALSIPQHLDKRVNEAVGAAGNEYPVTSTAADVTGFLGPGSLAFKGLEKGAGAVGARLAPALRPPTGTGVMSRLGRYAPVVAGGTAAGVGDYTLYEGTVGAGTRAAQEGRTPEIGERLDAAWRAPSDPWAYTGGFASPFYRVGRAAVTGSFTPTPRAQWAQSVMTPKTPQSEAYKMIAKRLDKDRITPAQLHKAIDNYHYAGYSTVDEMLFELAEASSGGQGAGQLKQLAVALGSVGGDAQQIARDNFRERRLGSLTRLRDDLRKAAGLEGSDFYKYSDQLKEAERTLPDYGPAYSQSVTDESWSQKLWPQLQTSPSAREALDRAWKYASDRGDLEVAREIDTLVQGLGPNPARSGVSSGTGTNVPQKPSTQALDYIDRSLGGKAHSLRARGDGDIASGAQEAQTGLRSIVDAETGLDQPRRVVHELKTAQRALDFGRKAAANGTDLETIQREFTREMKKFANDGVDVLGDETATINASLMMGWVRGAEDMISKASNPGTAIRQLYGTPRQREKMITMLQGLDESGLNLSTGKQSDATKRLRQVTGDKYGAGETAKGRGRFDRERLMLDSENQITLNSQTGQRNEAVAAQGGLENKINMALDAIDAPRQMAKKAVRHGVNRLVRPGIYKPEVNRALGDIMFTGGRDNLKRIVGELENLHAPPAPIKKAPGGPITPPAPVTPAAAIAASQGKPVANGLPIVIDRHGGAMGAAGGFYASPDLNGDGEVSMPERIKSSVIGGIIGRGVKKGAQRLNKTRPAGMRQYEEAKVRVMTGESPPRPSTPEFEAAVIQEMEKFGYAGPRSKQLQKAIDTAPDRFSDDFVTEAVPTPAPSGKPALNMVGSQVMSLKKAQKSAIGLNGYDFPAGKPVIRRQVDVEAGLPPGMSEEEFIFNVRDNPVPTETIAHVLGRTKQEIDDFYYGMIDLGMDPRRLLTKDEIRFLKKGGSMKELVEREGVQAPARWNKQAGAVDIGNGPQRRKDLLKDAMSKSQGAPVEGITQPSRRADPSLNAPYAKGPPGGPLPLLAGVGAAGVAGTYAYDQLTQPKATMQPPAPLPQIPQSFGPSVKPDLSGVQQASVERANMDARAQDQAERQEYWQYLKSRGDGSSIEWNRIQQERAGELALKPEDIARGVIRKRLPYVYGSTPVSVLSEAPIEELIDGHWRPVEPSPATVR